MVCRPGRGAEEGVGAVGSWCLEGRGYLGRVLLAEPLAGVGQGKQRQVEEGTSGADVKVVGEELTLDGAEGVAREVPAHHKPCRERAGECWDKAPSPVPPRWAQSTAHPTYRPRRSPRPAFPRRWRGRAAAAV